MNQMIQIKSAILMALFYVIFIHGNTIVSAPLTPSIYTVNEGMVEGSVSTDYVSAHSSFMKEKIVLNLGVMPKTNLRFTAGWLQIIDNNSLSSSTIGDSSIGIWHSFGSLFNNFILGYYIDIGLATGQNAFNDETKYPTESGFSTVSWGLVGAYTVHNVTFIMAGKYELMPEDSSSVFDGLTFNVADSNTWKRFFGLNPFSKDAMLYYKKFKNDIIAFSLTALYNGYPVILYMSLSSGNRLNNRPVYGDHNLPILYKGYNDTIFMVVASGARYFFNEKTYFGAFLMYNIIRDYSYAVKYSLGIEVSSLW